MCVSHGHRTLETWVRIGKKLSGLPVKSINGTTITAAAAKKMKTKKKNEGKILCTKITWFQEKQEIRLHSWNGEVFHNIK